jgi:ubiquinone/menaquinone biosynthesis C-methylase UbiE
MDPHARILAARLMNLASGRILELAAGTGALTRALTDSLPETVSIVATDLNESMLAQARMQPGAERVIWQQADASSLPFPDQHFDAVVCQFGAMFFPDKLLAFGEALRVLRPGGRFVFNVWDHMECNPLFDVLRQMVTDLFPDNPPHVPSLAWSYCDPATLRADLKAAGFHDVTIDVITDFERARSSRDAAIGVVLGGVVRDEIAARGTDWLERVIAGIASTMMTRYGDGPDAIPNQALIIVARRLSR